MELLRSTRAAAVPERWVLSRLALAARRREARPESRRMCVRCAWRTRRHARARARNRRFEASPQVAPQRRRTSPHAPLA